MTNDFVEDLTDALDEEDLPYILFIGTNPDRPAIRITSNNLDRFEYMDYATNYDCVAHLFQTFLDEAEADGDL